MTTPPPRPETIDRLGNAVYPSFAMLAGMQLGLFTPLGKGPMTAEQIAKALDVRANTLIPLLYALVTAELLTVDGDHFANSPEADHFLVRGKPAYIGARHENLSIRWTTTLKTAESIATGFPQAKIDYAGMSASELESHYRGFYLATIAAVRALLERYDFSAYRTLLDVGGGTGGLSIAATEACPQLKATVLDLPTVTPFTQRFVEEAGAAGRVQVMAADVVSGPLTGSFDAAVLANLIQVLPRGQARSALRNVGQVVKPGGDIFILGFVLDESSLSPPEAIGFNLLALNIFDEGQAYTEQEHRDWLSEAGFEGFERLVLPDGRSILKARKPG